MIYVWTISNNYPDEFIGEYDVGASPDRFKFKNSEKLSTNETPVVRFGVNAESLTEFDDLASNAMVPIISPVIVSALNEFDLDIQLIDVRIIAKDKEVPGYKLLNVLGKISALDRENSEFNYIPGTEQIMGFSELAYLNVEVGIARDADYLSNILVSEHISRKLLEISPEIGIYKPSQLDL